MFFGKRRSVPPTGKDSGARPAVEPELYVVAYESMLKGNKLFRKGKPIRQVAVVVEGTARLVTSGDRVDRRTFDALIGAGVLPPPGAPRPIDAANARKLPLSED